MMQVTSRWTTPRGTVFARACGPIATLVLAAMLELARGSSVSIPNPPALFVIAIVVSAFLGGIGPGVASAAIAWVYTAYHFSVPGHPFSFTDENVRRVSVWAVAMPFTAVLVGVLNRRVAAEEQLRRSEHRFRTFVDHATDAFFLHDAQGRILDVNQQACASLGYTRDELVARSTIDIDADHDAVALAAVRKRLDAGEMVTLETHHRRKDGSVFPVEVRVRPFREGGRRFSVSLARDVTDRMRADAELAQLEGQLRQAQKMEAVGRLAGGVAHDFNNLLTAIIASSELLMETLAGDAESSELVAEIQRAGDRAATLTRQLLAFSRKQVLQPQVVSLNALLVETVKLLKRLVAEDIEIELVADSSLGAARVDPAQFEQAIMNLAINARDAMPQGGSLVITTANQDVDEVFAARHTDLRPGRYVRVTVKDSGHGMDEATRARIFEPFFTTKEAGKGTGLGLAMVYGFVKQSGGHIEVNGEIGQGTTFDVYVPRADEAATSPNAPSLPVADTAIGKETVLLVEDEDAVRLLARQILQSRGYAVLEARDGREGLLVADRHRGSIDLLVTDVVMPRMNGPQLAEALVERRPGLRILFVSGYSDESVLRDGMLGPHTGLLLKPFSPTHLIRKVREILDAPSALV